MPKQVYIKNGAVVNVVSSPAAVAGLFDAIREVSDATVINVGDAADPDDAKVDVIDVVLQKLGLNHENWLRALTGRGQVDDTTYRTALKGLINNPPPAVTPGSVKRIVQFNTNITIGALTAATYTDKTFTVPGLLTTDLILSVTFTAGLTPNTVSYMPLRVSATDTLDIRFEKITTGSVTPPAPQAISVLAAR